MLTKRHFSRQKISLGCAWRGVSSMDLTDEMKDRGRRNFLKAIVGAPALAGVGAAAITRGPVRGGPVKAALIGTGDMGTGHLRQCQKEFIDLKALCDINSTRRRSAAEMLGN